MSYSAFSPSEVIQSKDDATIDPTVNDDSTQGYVVLSRWVNVTSNNEFVCVDATAAAAIWLSTTTAPAGGGGGGLGQWDYVTGAGAPAATKITANTDLMSTVTTINIADGSGTDNNFSSAFGAVRAGDYLVVRDSAGGAAFGSFLVTAAPVDNTTYWTFTVSTGDVSGSFTATNTYDVNIISDGNVVGPAASTTNALVRYSSATGRAIKSLSTATLTDTTALLLSGTQAEAQLQQRSTGSTPTADHGTFWVRDDAPTTPWFTDDTDVDHNLNRPTPTTLATNELIQLDQTEIVIGGGYLDGGTGGTFSWEALATQIDGGGGVLILTSEIRLYDMGPDGTPTAGTLRSSLEFPTDDSLDRVSLALTASASPGTDTDTIQDAPRMYEVRAYLDSTGGNVDSLSVLSVTFVES